MSLTLVASLIPESALHAAVGTDAALQLEALLEPEVAVAANFASDALVLTLGPYILVGSSDAHISSDPGNAIISGSDGGLFVPSNIDGGIFL